MLEKERKLHPSLGDDLRIIATLGPSPMPPWVIHKSVDPALRAAVARTLIQMHADPDGRAILDEWGISHFTAAADALFGTDRFLHSLAASRGITLTESVAALWSAIEAWSAGAALEDDATLVALQIEHP